MAGLNRMMRGRVLAERTGAVRDGKRRGPRKAPRLFGGVGSWWCAVIPGPLGICAPCKLKGPILFRYLGFCRFYTACAEAVGQIDLFYGTGTHYDKNCWVYREALWLSARSPSEYAGKRLKMAVSKRLADHHRAAKRILIPYAHARGSYGG